MKNTMKNTNLINKLKTEPKFRKNVIAITASSLVLVICAVSIPVGLHVRNSNVEHAAAENTTISIAEATTLSAGADEVSITEPTTLTAVVSETTTASAVTTQVQNDKTSSNNSSSSSTSNKTASGTSNSSGSSNKTNNQSKPTTTKAPSTTKKAQTTTQSYNYNWNQSQVNNFIAKSRTYGENIGLIWDDSFNLTNASWQLSIHSRYSGNSENEVYEKMKELIEYTKTSSGAKYFKIYPEQNDGGWEFTILWMK